MWGNLLCFLKCCCIWYDDFWNFCVFYDSILELILDCDGFWLLIIFVILDRSWLVVDVFGFWLMVFTFNARVGIIFGLTRVSINTNMLHWIEKEESWLMIRNQRSRKRVANKKGNIGEDKTRRKSNTRRLKFDTKPIKRTRSPNVRKPTHGGKHKRKEGENEDYKGRKVG